MPPPAIPPPNWIDSDRQAFLPTKCRPMTHPIEPPAPSGAPSVQPETRKPETSGSEPPIAIVGMACRFPGADGIPAFWRLLDPQRRQRTVAWALARGM